MIPARTPEEMSKAAWEAINQLTYEGQITMPAGGQVKPDAKVIVETFKWLAMFHGKPRKTPKAMDDWQPKETKQ